MKRRSQTLTKVVKKEDPVPRRTSETIQRNTTLKSVILCFVTYENVRDLRRKTSLEGDYIQVTLK